jgi:microcystin-dependent protein
MPDFDAFFLVASDMKARTVVLSGDSSALLFSALAAINAYWQWTSETGITRSQWDDIQALIDKANDQLMTPEIGKIIMYTTADAPLFTLPCDGEEYAREDYPDLYAVLHPNYIVDADTFVTPALQSRSPIGAGSAAGLSSYAVNEIAGEENHELTESENALHSHSDAGHTHIYQPPGATGLFVSPGEVPALLPALLPSNTTTGFASIQSSGDSEPHNTVHPVNAVLFAVYYA